MLSNAEFFNLFSLPKPTITFLNKVNELVEKKKVLIQNMKKGKSKMGNDAVLEVIMSEIKNK